MRGRRATLQQILARDTDDAELIDPKHVRHIFVSPRKRAQRTAELVRPMSLIPSGTPVRHEKDGEPRNRLQSSLSALAAA